MQKTYKDSRVNQNQQSGQQSDQQILQPIPNAKQQITRKDNDTFDQQDQEGYDVFRMTEHQLQELKKSEEEREAIRKNRLDTAWRIYTGDKKLKMPEKGDLVEGYELYRRIFNTFNGKIGTISNGKGDVYDVDCIETPTRKYYFFFLGEIYQRATGKNEKVKDLNFVFEDKTKEYTIFIPVYSNPSSILDRHGESVTKLFGKGKLTSKIKDFAKKIKRELSKPFQKGGTGISGFLEKIYNGIQDVKAFATGHSFVLSIEFSVDENARNARKDRYYDSMMLENDIHVKTLTKEVKEMINSEKLQSIRDDKIQPPFNYSCVFYTYKFIYDVIKKDLYFDDKLTIFLESYTLLGDSLHKFIEKLLIIIDFQIRKIEMKELAPQIEMKELAPQIEMKEPAPQIGMKKPAQLQEELRKLANNKFSDSQSQSQEQTLMQNNKRPTQQEQTRRMMQNDKKFKKRSKQNKLEQPDKQQFKEYHIIEQQTQQMKQILKALRRQQEDEGKRLYDLLRTEYISNIVLVEKDFPDEKTFVNKNKLVEAFNNTALQDEDTIFDIIIGYFFLKLKVKLLNSTIRNYISEEDTKYFKNQLHAICKDPVPLHAKIINMSNIIIYFLTVPNSITTQSPLENIAVSSTTSLSL